MKKSNIKPTLVLGCICLCSALLLSGINMLTAPIIADRVNSQADAALLEVLPGGTNFTEVSPLPQSVDKAWKADNGYVFQITYSGYNSGNIVMVGVDMDGKIVNTKMISCPDTYEHYKGKLSGAWNTDDETEIKNSLYDEFGLSTSATSKSLEGFTGAMRIAINAYKSLSGEEVDYRTPEEILQDNCKEALGTDKRNFTQWYVSSKTLGDAKIYVNDKGVVISSGDHFVGYLFGSNTPYGTPTAEALAATASAYEFYSSMIRIDPNSYTGISNIAKYVYKMSDGAYLFRLASFGFSDTPIIIELVIDKDGKIANCVTISQSESDGYGAPCGTPEYYEQYNGKDAGNYDEVPNIIASSASPSAANGGATYTSGAYKDAIKAAFDVFKALTTTEGGNE